MQSRQREHADLNARVKNITNENEKRKRDMYDTKRSIVIATAESEFQVLYERDGQRVWDYIALLKLTLTFPPVLILALYLNAEAIYAVVVPCVVVCVVVILPMLKISLALGTVTTWKTRAYVCMVAQMISVCMVIPCTHAVFDIVAGTISNQSGAVDGPTSTGSYYIQSVIGIVYMVVVWGTLYTSCDLLPSTLAIPSFVPYSDSDDVDT